MFASETPISGTFRWPQPSVLSQKYCHTNGRRTPYKWDCITNRKCTAGLPFLQGFEARKVQQLKWGAYCRTNWMCTAVLSLRQVGVGVPETLLTSVWVQKLTRSSLKGFWKGLWKTSLTCFEAIFSYKRPIPERRKTACKTILQAKNLMWTLIDPDVEHLMTQVFAPKTRKMSKMCWNPIFIVFLKRHTYKPQTKKTI